MVDVAPRPWGGARALARVLVSSQAREDAWHEWRRRLVGEPGLPGSVQRVLVVCHGNLCRSPFAGARMAQCLPALRVRSAGLAASGDDPAPEAAVRAATRRGVDLGPHRTRPVSDQDVADADLILGMQGRHAAELVRRWPACEARVRLLGDFLPEPPFAIADPWGRDDAFFEAVFVRLEAAVARLAQRIERVAP